MEKHICAFTAYVFFSSENEQEQKRSLKTAAIGCEKFLFCGVWMVSIKINAQECKKALSLCDLPANHWSNLVFHIHEESRGPR